MAKTEPTEKKVRKERVINPILKAKQAVADAQSKVDRLSKYTEQLATATKERDAAKESYVTLLKAEQDALA